MSCLWDVVFPRVVLNTTLGPSFALEERPPDPSQVAATVNRTILRLYGKFLNADGSAVDYIGMKDSPLFEEFVEETRKLPEITLDGLSESERKALFLNLYNALVIHGYLRLGVPVNTLQRTRFYQTAAYRIGPHVFSLDDMEHGVLRANRKHPAFFFRSPQFAEKDPRLRFACSIVDPRIHFALVCGAKSCPPIRVYTPDNLDTALDLAAAAFLSSLAVDSDQHTVRASMILKWYGADFGNSERQMLQYVSQFLPEDRKDQLLKAVEEHFTVVYLPYDWNLNSGS